MRKPQSHHDDLMISLQVTLRLLRADVTSSDQDVRAYCAMGMVQSLLEHLSTSPRLTKEQRQQVALIAQTWHQAVFTPEALDNPTISQNGPTTIPTPESED